MPAGSRQGKTPGADRGIAALLDTFQTLVPNTEEAYTFLKDLPSKLGDLGEAGGSSNYLSTDSFLSQAW